MTLLTLLENAGSSSGLTVEIPDASPLRITGDITLEAWVVSRYKGQYGAIIGKLNTAYTIAEPYYLGLESGNLYFSLGNGATQAYIVSPNEISVGVPMHVVATCFRKIMRLFVNGAEVAIKYLESQEVKDGGKPIFIGAFGNETNRFTGLIGEVAIYNTGFSAKKALRHYHIGKQVLNAENAPYITTFDPPSYS